MPRFFFFFFFFFFLLLISLFLHSSSAARYRCRPEDAELLRQIFNTPGPVSDCCSLHEVGCNVNTSWVESLMIKELDTFTKVPPALGKMTNLVVLILAHLPNLRGEISPEIAKLTKLTYLRISWTNVTGHIPAWLGQLKELETLDLSFNKLTGSIPPVLGTLAKITWMRLDRNQLTGPIPESFGRFPGKRLHLSHNQLSGIVPKSLGQVDFEYLDLQSNRLSGDSSHLFSNRSKLLTEIYLSRNLFDFDFTNAVFPENTLTTMDLSHNMIRGSISVDIVNVAGLNFFNVSFNRLCGKIPQGGAVQTLPATSFVNNRCLCGPPLPNKC